MGNEIERSLNGQVNKKISRDTQGRVTNLSVQNKNLEGSKREYVWGTANQLQKIIHSNGQTIEFEYDQIGNLFSGTYNGIEKIYKCPDVVGNLFKDPKRKDRTYAKSGRLIEDENYEYKYDVEGFLIQKISKNEYSNSINLLDVENESLKASWTYQWTAGGQLKSVIDPKGKRSDYEYDALGRRTAKIINRKKINRYLYDGNVLLHEWKYNVSERPKLVVTPEGNLAYDKNEPIPKDITTWIFDENTFVPSAKLVGDRHYSIISDYLGTPIEAYDDKGNKVWECQLDVYGAVHTCKEDKNFIPFRYQGQYEDSETGLYYNRFRYYSPESGAYISQDPIGLEGENPNIYAYTHDVNGWVDVLGLMAFGSGKPVHYAYAFIFDEEGNLINESPLKSGDMTPAEKALGFPQNSLATHTEARAVKKFPLQKGQRMEIIAQYHPCPTCQGKMRKATKKGGIIDYKWIDDNGKLQWARWQDNKKIFDTRTLEAKKKKAKNKKKH